MYFYIKKSNISNILFCNIACITICLIYVLHCSVFANESRISIHRINNSSNNSYHINNSINSVNYINYINYTSNITNISDISKDFKIIKKINTWDVFLRKKDHTCHIISSPIETRFFNDKKRNHPYFMISYKKPDIYTIGISVGFMIDKTKDVIFSCNDTERLVKPFIGEYAYTYNIRDDIAIINDMIEDSKFFTIKSYSVSNQDFALDTYSLSGFINALQYMHRNCIK